MTDEQYQKAVEIVQKAMEPKVEKMIAVLNKTLKQHGVQAGVELKWFFEEIKNEKEIEVDSSERVSSTRRKRGLFGL